MKIKRLFGYAYSPPFLIEWYGVEGREQRPCGQYQEQLGPAQPAILDCPVTNNYALLESAIRPAVQPKSSRSHGAEPSRI